MKKRLVAFLLILSLLQTFIGFSVFAGNDIGASPEEPVNLEVFLDEAGVQDYLGESYADLADNFSKQNLPAADLSGAAYIEFDLFASNAETVLAAASAAEKAGGGLSFVLGTGENKDEKNAFAALKGISLNDGWNHVRISSTVFEAEDGFDMAAVNGWYLTFTGEILAEALPEGARSEYLKIMNIAGTAEHIDVLPELPDERSIKTVISEEGVKTEYGLKYDSMNGKTVNFETSLNITDAEYIEFDLYVPNLESFAAYAQSCDFYLSFYTKDSIYHKRADFSFKDQVTKTGWNHIKLDKNSYVSRGNAGNDAIADWSNILKAGLRVHAKTSPNTICPDEIIRFANLCATIDLAKLPPELPDSKYIDSIITAEGMGGEYGATYEDIKKLNKPVSPAADISNADLIEFDIYIEDLERFKAYSESCSFYLSLYTGSDDWAKRADFTFGDQVAKVGWNHIRLDKSDYVSRGNSGNNAVADWKNIVKVSFYVYNKSGKNEICPKEYIKAANICGTFDPVKIPPELPENAETVYSKNGTGAALADNYSKLIDATNTAFAEPFDFTGADMIEFDVYIEDFAEFTEIREQALAANRDFYVTFNSDQKNLYLKRLIYPIGKLIKNDGWNHISFPRAAMLQRLNDSGASPSKIYNWYIGFDGWVASTGEHKGFYFKTANLCSSKGEISEVPEMPENVIAVIDKEGRQSALGHKFSWTMDYLYCENEEPLDLTEATAIEFDLYVDDIDLLKKTIAESDAVSEFQFSLSSALPSDYVGQKPRNYKKNDFRGLLDQITHNGWNHIKFKPANMIASGNGTFDITNTHSWALSFYGDWKTISSDNPAKFVYMKAVNVCATALLTMLPEDKETVYQPDKNTVYITSADMLADEYGTWNPQPVEVSEKYHTEGKASIQNTFFDQDLISNQIRYIFNDPMDMRDLKTLKLDMFVGIGDLLKSSVKKLSVAVSSESRGNNDYYKWIINTSQLKEGWNSLTFDLSDAVISGSPEISMVQTIILICEDAAFGEYDFVDIGLDNLRYISSAGNKTLKVFSNETNSTPDFGLDEEIPDIEDMPNPPVIEPGEIDRNDGQAVMTPDTQIIKKRLVTTVTDTLTHAVVLGIEVAVATLGVAVYIIIDKKRRKNAKR